MARACPIMHCAAASSAAAVVIYIAAPKQARHHRALRAFAARLNIVGAILSKPVHHRRSVGAEEKAHVRSKLLSIIGQEDSQVRSGLLIAATVRTAAVPWPLKICSGTYMHSVEAGVLCRRR